MPKELVVDQVRNPTSAVIPDGWRPVPFREFIVKVVGRCDLACDYCYMFAMADQGWRDQPRVMSEGVADDIGRAIGDHVTRHRVADISLVLHGGEPLLAGAEALVRLASRLRARVPPGTTIRTSVQTNGVRLTAAVLDVLASAGIRIAVSVDGDAASHDRHRRRADGSGTYMSVARAIRLLGQNQYRDVFAGLLCVIDLANDPVDVYTALAGFRPPVIDFLLPHGNWSVPPPGRRFDGATPYGGWLSRAFDAWYRSPAGRPEVRLFREIVTLLIGGHSRTEQVGLSPAAMVVFNVDGAIEQVDSLRSVGPGAAATGLSVRGHDLEAALRHPSIVVRQLGPMGLANECQECPVMPVCGGGHYPHRFRSGRGFFNPSVYCPDLDRLIRHIRAQVVADIAESGRVA
ncbi:FxsB family radical SAM/SPASM domain protein [Micromonospora sp. CPCC 205371]|nr:FxsB family radical SAM/SPASM domain protein [Micromonospora sp. CPCC 205371]